MSDLGDKAKDFLNSDKGEQVSDAAIKQGESAADKASGGGHTEQIDAAGGVVDGKIGS